MPTFLSLPKLYLLLSYFLITCMPFFSYMLGKPVEHPSRLLIYGLLGWLVLWSLFKSPRWFHYVLLPAFLALPIEIYLRLDFGQGISTHHLGIIYRNKSKRGLGISWKQNLATALRLCNHTSLVVDLIENSQNDACA